MSQPRRRRWHWLLLVIAGYIVFLFARKAALDANRPMFHNLYGKNDRMFLSRWVFTPPMIDRAGNFANYDKKLNLFVVVFTHEKDGYNRFALWGSYDGATLTMETSNGRETLLSFQRAENRLLVFDLKLKLQFEDKLGPGEAMALRALANPVDRFPDDIGVELEKTLRERHYPRDAQPLILEREVP